MATFFKDIDDLRQHLSVTKAFSIEEFDTKLTYATDIYLKEWLGQELLDNVSAAYAASPGTPMPVQYEVILPKIQFVLAHFTFLEEIPYIELTIDDSGITRAESEHSKTAYSAQINALKDKIAETGYNGLELLLEFLEENEVDYPEWVTTDGYTKNKDHFINTASDFSDNYNLLRGRQTFKVLTHIMDDMEIFYLLPLMGQDWFDELKQKIQDKAVLSDFEEKALNYIQRSVANLTISNAVKHLLVRVTPKGIISLEHDKDTSYEIEKTGSDNGSSAKLRAAEDLGKKYLNRLLTYLQANLDEFPTYRDDETVNPPDDETTDCDPCNTSGGGIYVA